MGNDSTNAPCRPARSADFEGNLMTNLYEREDAYIPRVAAIHDLCGYGKCSLGVAIPVLSAAGCDVCPVPTGLFSSHTAFPGWYMHDTTDILGDYLAAWAGIGVELDAVYSGFLGAPEQVDIIKQVWETYPKALRVVDPVMADHGKVYPTYTPELVEAMGTLANGADILTPNLTEAALLLDEPFRAMDALTKTVVHQFLLQVYDRSKTTVFFITHDLEEAIFLGSKVYIMTTRPATIKKILDVDIPRPRDFRVLSSPTYTRLKEECISAVHEEVLKAFKAGEREM